MTIVVDASLLVAALVDDGTDGQWAESELVGDYLAAPHLVYVEVANILRRAVRGKAISEDVAALAHSDLLALRIELFPYELVAERVWELRGNVTAYDAWYVAIAEQLNAPLVTLDQKLSKASGPTCAFRLPPRPRPRPRSLR
jgi:predicted nucleic acid-binding protein